MVRLLSHQITVPFIDSHSDNFGLIAIIGVSAFLLFVYSTQVLSSLKRFPLNYFEDYTTGRDVQLPMGPILPKDIVEDFHRVILIYIPCIVIFLLFLGPFIAGIMAAILEFSSMLPSAIQDHIGRFVRAIGRGVSSSLLPVPVAVWRY